MEAFFITALCSWYDDVWIFYECFGEFLLFCSSTTLNSFCISVLEHDIECNTFHSDCFEILDKISVDRFWYAQHLQIWRCLETVECRIIDLDDDYIFRRYKAIFIEPVQCSNIFSVDKEMRKRKSETLTEKSEHTENQKKTHTRDDQNMFEIFLNLHIISIVSDFSLESKNRYPLFRKNNRIKIQKFLIISYMLSSFLRGIMFTLWCLLTLLVFSGIAEAASGGKFGEILAQILGITPEQVLTYAWDGTVANANKLGWLPASNFQKVVPNQSCGAGKCIFGFDTSGNVQCR